MSTLIAERRVNKRGHLVTKHVRAQQAPAPRLVLVPVPAPAPETPDPVECDDLNVMASVGVHDYSSSACEKVESYLEEEYGATFEYSDEGAETVSFRSNDDADRFSADFYNGALRDELREIADEA